MRNKITMEMSICQAENGFSLDELVKKFTDAFENKVFAEILKINLQLTQEVLIYRIFNGKSNQQCCRQHWQYINIFHKIQDNNFFLKKSIFLRIFI